MVATEVQCSLDEAVVVQVQVQWKVEPLDVDVVVDLVVVRRGVMWMPPSMVCPGAAAGAAAAATAASVW